MPVFRTTCEPRRTRRLGARPRSSAGARPDRGGLHHHRRRPSAEGGRRSPTSTWPRSTRRGRRACALPRATSPPTTSVDEIGDGRLVAIVFDDVNLPADDPDIVRATRETARYIVDQLGPSDMAAVVSSRSRPGGRRTSPPIARSCSRPSIGSSPSRWNLRTPTPTRHGAGGGDMIQRWSPTLMRSPCMRNEPAVPTLDTVASRMATAPGRRKALVFLSVGVSMSLDVEQRLRR